MTDQSSNTPVPPSNVEDEGISIDLKSLVIALIGFIAGFAVAWLAFTTTLNTSTLKNEIIGAIQPAVSTAVSGAGLAMIPTDAPTPTAIPKQDVQVGDAPFWGPADAKVTIIEFSDFECPYCQRFSSSTYKQIKEKYGDQVRFVYKHFPLVAIHPDAFPSALAAECAREQNKFWEYHDTLFANPGKLSSADLLQYAKDVKVENFDQFQQCFSSQKYIDRVNADLAQGESHFVTGTPSFFVNGNIIPGAVPFQYFDAFIQQALNEAQG